MLEIYGRSDSSNVQAVMWCVAELGLEHIRYDIGHRFGGTNTKEFIDMNPNQTVPSFAIKMDLHFGRVAPFFAI